MVSIEAFNSTPKCEHDVRSLVQLVVLGQGALVKALQAADGVAIHCQGCGALAFMLRHHGEAPDDARDIQR